ncbi:uncharacterized protein [Argopecten irradians]|uniref:uncharacterized protein isoform X1 n=1 Tax=Argopecten irradians TaxID=31199 RepID=UPI00371E32A7
MRIGDGECSHETFLDPALHGIFRNKVMEDNPKQSEDFIPLFDAAVMQKTDPNLNISEILINQRNKSNRTRYKVCQSHNKFVTPQTLPWIPPTNSCHLSIQNISAIYDSKGLTESPKTNMDERPSQEQTDEHSLNISGCTGMLTNSTCSVDSLNLQSSELLNKCNCSQTQTLEVNSRSEVILNSQRNANNHQSHCGHLSDISQSYNCPCVSTESISEWNLIQTQDRWKSVLQQNGRLEQNNNYGEPNRESKLTCDKTDINRNVECENNENSTKEQNCDSTLDDTKNVPAVKPRHSNSKDDLSVPCGGCCGNRKVPMSPKSCCHGKKGKKCEEESLCPKYETICTNGSYQYTVWTIPDPRNQKLTWNKPPLTVLVVKKLFDDGALSAFLSLVIWLIKTQNMVVYCESSILKDSILVTDEKFKEIQSKIQIFNEENDDLTNKVDFIICLGGDGTLLYASSLFQSSVPPVMAFNLGSLGFLTPFNFNNFKEQVSCVLEGNASLLLRYRLKCIVSKRDNFSPTNGPIPSRVGARILVFNEVVIDRGQSSYLTNLDLYVEGRLVTTAQGDGIIISTPTGSTAYAMAAGASMVHPSVPAIVITPICPHSLSFRPIVVPAGVEIKVSVAPDSRNPASASFDGRDRQEITQGDSVIITTAQYPVPSVCFKDQMDDWFESLAQCLHWNVRKQQKPLASTPSVTSLDSLDLSN